MSRAVSFGSEAAAYDAARPDYPGVAAEFVLSLSPVETAIEIGAGTGKATAAFAAEGLAITCLEPDPAMAAILASKRLPGVSIVEATFESWPGPSQPADLVFAGQAWHWLDPDTAAARARGWLRDGGIVALLWNIPTHRYDRFAGIYRRHAPELLDEGDPRIGFRDSDVWLEDLERGGFAEAQLTTFDWTDRLSPLQVRTLYSSYSDHIALEEPVREALLDDLEREVADAGEPFLIEYETRVFTARRS